MLTRANHASCRETLREQRNARLGNRQPTAPLTRPLPPNRPKAGDSGGEEKIGWNADPGRREGLLPLACPGLLSDALTGLSRGSSGLLPLHFSKNVQSPASLHRRGPTPAPLHRRGIGGSKHVTLCSETVLKISCLPALTGTASGLPAHLLSPSEFLQRPHAHLA